mmetsp:Transcript_32466/g.98106  ORF Transcript_32466/g.98106 Transcript_32466/m.98106 type:complete len:421 (-) Transcript_32466:4117-5379(-)
MSHLGGGEGCQHTGSGWYSPARATSAPFSSWRSSAAHHLRAAAPARASSGPKAAVPALHRTRHGHSHRDWFTLHSSHPSISTLPNNFRATSRGASHLRKAKEVRSRNARSAATHFLWQMGKAPSHTPSSAGAHSNGVSTNWGLPSGKHLESFCCQQHGVPLPLMCLAHAFRSRIDSHDRDDLDVAGCFTHEKEPAAATAYPALHTMLQEHESSPAWQRHLPSNRTWSRFFSAVIFRCIWSCLHSQTVGSSMQNGGRPKPFLSHVVRLPSFPPPTNTVPFRQLAKQAHLPNLPSATEHSSQPWLTTFSTSSRLLWHFGMQTGSASKRPKYLWKQAVGKDVISSDSFATQVLPSKVRPSSFQQHDLSLEPKPFFSWAVRHAFSSVNTLQSSTNAFLGFLLALHVFCSGAFSGGKSPALKVAM